jgi:hypothetical protein
VIEAAAAAITCTARESGISRFNMPCIHLSLLSMSRERERERERERGRGCCLQAGVAQGWFFLACVYLHMICIMRERERENQCMHGLLLSTTLMNDDVDRRWDRAPN